MVTINEYLDTKINSTIQLIKNNQCNVNKDILGCNLINDSNRFNSGDYTPECAQNLRTLCENQNNDFGIVNYSSFLDERYNIYIPTLIELLRVLLLKSVKDANNNLLEGLHNYSSMINNDIRLRPILKIIQYSLDSDKFISQLNLVHDEEIKHLSCDLNLSSQNYPYINIDLNNLRLVVENVNNLPECSSESDIERDNIEHFDEIDFLNQFENKLYESLELTGKFDLLKKVLIENNSFNDSKQIPI